MAARVINPEIHWRTRNAASDMPHYGFMGNRSTLGDHEATHAELVQFVGDARADDYAIVNDYLYPMVWLKHITVGGGRDGKPPKATTGCTLATRRWPSINPSMEHHVSAEALQAYPYRRPGPGPSRVATHARFIAPGSE